MHVCDQTTMVHGSMHFKNVDGDAVIVSSSLNRQRIENIYNQQRT